MRQFFAMAALCAASVLLAQTPAPNSPADKLTIEAIYAEGGITGRAPEELQWSPDGKKFSFVQRDDSGEHGELWYVDVASGKKAVLVGESKLQSLAPPSSRITNERQKEWMQRYSVAAYHWAPDSKHLLFDSQGQLWLFDLDKGVGVQITSAPEPSTDPKFSADGQHIAYVRKHDLWTRRVSDGRETRLTKDGDDNLLNGEVDWVYAEELDVRSNYFWSPDGNRIAFLQMNEKQVPTYPITDYVPLHAKVEDEKYPNPGDHNPEVRVGVVKSSGGNVRWISVPDTDSNDYYIPRFDWINDNTLYVQVLNRLQNEMKLYFVDAGSGRAQLMLKESEPDAWVEVEHHFTLLKSKDRFVWSSWRDGHTHLYLYSFDQSNPLSAPAKLESQLTKGDFEVFSVDGLDDSTNTVYFTANPDDPRQRQLYSVKLDGSGMQPVSKEKGTHQAKFPTDAKYYADNFSALMTPPSLSVCQISGNCTPVWQARAVSQFSLLQPQELEMKAADGTTTLYGTLLMPLGTMADSSRKIPLILHPYGGPGAQLVRDSWGGTSFLFDEIMAKQGFAVLTVDNRGMLGRGKGFSQVIKHHFGENEFKDQLAALDQVLKRYPMLDGDRLGWWGWSYGGYMTLYATTHSDRFKAAIAGAPVTNWRLYDSIYTERYMGLPKDNDGGYVNSSPITSAANLKGHLLIIHGTSDDNVHIQNSIQMIENLIRGQIQFDVQLYPGKTHGVSGTTDRVHLGHLVEDHFARWLTNVSTKTPSGSPAQ